MEELLRHKYGCRLVGYKVDEKEVIEAYEGLTDLERAFRTMKSALQLRPFYHNAGFSAGTAFESLSQLVLNSLLAA